jgi:hypothetical protein
MGKIAIRQETAHYRNGIHTGYFMRYWEFGPIFNVYPTMSEAIRHIKACVRVKQANFTLAGNVMA